MNTCGTCKLWTEDKNVKGVEIEGDCCFNPPTVHILMTPVRTIQGDAMQAQIMSLYPRTKASNFCAKHQPKLNG